jgi:hypothetical protein
MTMVPQVLLGLRGLANLGLPDQILRGCDLKRLMEDELGIEFHCCSKTFGKALAAVAALTPLLNPVGKRWALPLGDGSLRVTLASVPVGESVSRTGKKPRGPPW